MIIAAHLSTKTGWPLEDDLAKILDSGLTFDLLLAPAYANLSYNQREKLRVRAKGRIIIPGSALFQRGHNLYEHTHILSQENKKHRSYEFPLVKVVPNNCLPGWMKQTNSLFVTAAKQTNRNVCLQNRALMLAITFGEEHVGRYAKENSEHAVNSHHMPNLEVILGYRIPFLEWEKTVVQSDGVALLINKDPLRIEAIKAGNPLRPSASILFDGGCTVFYTVELPQPAFTK